MALAQELLMPSQTFDLRPFQSEALNALTRDAHVVCISPTGSGKSLIYETMARVPGTRIILVSPLVALARQQHQKLLEIGVRSSLGAGPNPEPPPQWKSGSWILSPERLSHPKTQHHLTHWNPTLLVVDECHCLWEWGDHFRPAFRSIPALLQAHSIRKSLWLTATLPRSARKQLGDILPDPIIDIGGFDLPASLRLHVRRVPWTERVSHLLDWVHSKREAGIVFVQTRAMAERLVRLISATRRKCVLYHAGLGNEERQFTEAMIGGRHPDVVIATSAFGMGMNHPYLKWALLWQAPPSLLALAQAIGRAGRDSGSLNEAVVFWDEEDFRLLEWMVRDCSRKRQELENVHQFLQIDACRSQGLRSYFATADSGFTPCRRCDFCLRILQSPCSLIH